MIENFLIECYAQQLGTNNTQTFQTFDHACKVHFCLALQVALPSVLSDIPLLSCVFFCHKYKYV